MKSAFRVAIVSLFAFTALAPSFAATTVQVTPNHEDWQYKMAEPIEFVIEVLEEGKPISDVEINWTIGPDMMEPWFRGKDVLKDGKLVARSHGLDHPGFLRCIATIKRDGKEIRGLGTGGYEPYAIEPTTPMPEDFEDFWKSELAKLKDTPLDAKMEKIEKECTDKVDVYHVSFVGGPRQWGGSSRMYGMLAVPKGEGPFPAILQVPGAGIRPYNANKWLAEQGVIHLTVGIHGIPVNLPQELYDALGAGALNGYQDFNLENRDEYYYKRVFIGCVRAVDFLVSLPQCNPERMAIHGGSQGGALSLITAGLDSRLKFVAPMFPAMCDHYGYLYNRAGGWPHLFRGFDNPNRIPEKIETAPYYDVVNFARILKAPVKMGLGFNDETCPPTSMFAAYNVLTGVKEMNIYPRYGHQWIPEFDQLSSKWLVEELKK